MSITFPLRNMEKRHEDLIMLGLVNMLIGWSIVYQKILHFVCIAIFSNQILENKQMIISLLVKGSQIGRKKRKIQHSCWRPL